MRPDNQETRRGEKAEYPIQDKDNNIEMRKKDEKKKNPNEEREEDDREHTAPKGNMEKNACFLNK